MIAHSNGTYIISRLLLSEKNLELNKLVLCGSIVKRRYPWDYVQARLGHDVINEFGTRDIWPVLAKALSWGYGDTGRYRFGKPYVRDRKHNFAHSDYFGDGEEQGETFVRKFWKPWFQNERFVSSNEKGKSPLYLSLLSVFPIQWILVLVLSFFALAGLRNTDMPFLNPKVHIYLYHEGKDLEDDFHATFRTSTGRHKVEGRNGTCSIRLPDDSEKVRVTVTMDGYAMDEDLPSELPIETRMVDIDMVKTSPLAQVAKSESPSIPTTNVVQSANAGHDTLYRFKIRNAFPHAVELFILNSSTSTWSKAYFKEGNDARLFAFSSSYEKHYFVVRFPDGKEKNLGWVDFSFLQQKQDMEVLELILGEVPTTYKVEVPTP